ncbi:hypothetical protein U1Q18_015506 [Sarracenia purpurea var. burkii]
MAAPCCASNGAVWARFITERRLLCIIPVPPLRPILLRTTTSVPARRSGNHHSHWKASSFYQSQAMDHSFADELYSETLKLSNGESGPMISANNELNNSYEPEVDHLSHDDGSLWDSSHEEQNSLSDLDREWQRRRNQFHTIGYRDGVTAGKEASAQEGFNTGFKQSVLEGCSWGLVRGVTSALTWLPEELRGKLVETEEERNKFKSLYQSAQSLSTTDAMKFFHDSLVTKTSVEEQSEGVGASSGTAGLKFFHDSLVTKTSVEEQSEGVGASSGTAGLKFFHDSLVTKTSVEEQSEGVGASSGTAGLEHQSSNILQNHIGDLKALLIRCPAIEVNFDGDH